MVLKRRTHLATEIGGIAGALPPVIGWTSVSGTIDPHSILLFIIMFFWQPPHFWALAMRHEKDYEMARIPVLPLVRPQRLHFRFLLYLSLLFIASITPYIAGMSGWIYLLSAITTGILFLVIYSFSPISKKQLKVDMFSYSIVYITIIFFILMIDTKKAI